MEQEYIFTNTNIISRDAIRVDIVDKNDVILATNIKLYDFYLNKDLITNNESTIDIIVKIFPFLNKETLLKKITNHKSKLILIKNGITESQKNEIKKTIFGFEFMESLVRIYPHQELFSHIIGFTNSDKHGIEGLELQYNDYLDNKDNPPLKLTFDSRIQAILRKQLLKGMEKYKAKSIIGIVAEVKTGNVLALVNLPDFNPNQLNDVKRDVMYNKVTFGAFEMGSIFKIFTIAMALDGNIITENEQFDSSSKIDIGKYIIKQDYYSKKMINAKEILQKSSNIGAALIGLKGGADNMKQFYKKIGFFDKLPVKYPSLAMPLYPRTWRKSNTITTSYGYGMAVSPLHIIMGVSGIVNEGIMNIPKFVTSEKYEKVEIISQKTSKIMQNYLRDVVQNGTGFRANTLGYSVGGKTGSARLLGRGGEYLEGQIMANFVGIFPMNNPHYVVYVMVENPQDNNYKKNIDIAASNVTAPIVSKIIENIAPILNVVPYIEGL
ncbi:MAG: penicillin-binding protein 2 [Rickettsiales bacterium]|jgi:cell division protein FtsI (penicillin-binding protein 3)|nr:penicillin-binding protein 2 [Rickettsiales bacterium]